MGEAKEYSQGVCGDGAAILEDGRPLTIEDILQKLRELDFARRESEGLAMALWKRHYKDESPHFELCDSVPGVISQIDNMSTGLTRINGEVGGDE